MIVLTERGGVVMRPRSVKPLVLTVLVGALAACSSSPVASPAAAGSPSSSAPSTGSLTGIVRIYGGPINPTTKQGSGTGQPMPSYVVKLLRSGSVVATAMSDPSGRYTFLHVQPGAYSLACQGPQKFTVQAGATSTVDCSVVVA